MFFRHAANESFIAATGAIPSNTTSSGANQISMRSGR